MRGSQDTLKGLYLQSFASRYIQDMLTLWLLRTRGEDALIVSYSFPPNVVPWYSLVWMKTVNVYYYMQMVVNWPCYHLNHGLAGR